MNIEMSEREALAKIEEALPLFDEPPDNAKISISNKSGITGVCWNKKKSAWLASITYKRKWYYLGIFKSKNDAAIAYKNKKLKLNKIKKKATS